MRDLARQEIGSPRASVKSSRNKFLRLFAALIIVGALFWFAKGLLGGKSGVGSGGAVLSDAPNGLEGVAVDSSQFIASGGVELKSDKINLKLVKGDFKIGQGSASRTYGSGTYSISVDATLPDPVGQNYAVWVASSTGTKLVDYMKGSKTSWSLGSNIGSGFANYNQVWVTLERVKDQKPEEHVLEGTF